MEQKKDTEPTIQSKLEKAVEEMCDHYCKYPNEPGHEDNPDWLFEDDSPCSSCPLNRLV